MIPRCWNSPVRQLDRRHRVEYQVSFSLRIAKQGEIVRTGGCGPREDLLVGYELDLDNLLRISGVPLDAAAADLVEAMFAISKADRICPRGPGHLAPRSIEVQIPVRLPDLWMSHPIEASLRSLLAWLTGDDWKFRFSQRQDDSLWAESQTGFWPRIDSETDVILNSGGLDSLIGLAQWSAQSHDHRLIAVTTGKSELIHLAGDVVRQVRPALASNPKIDVLGIEESICWPDQSRNERESSWRTRALFPLAVGAVAVHLVGASKLQLFENGIGAIALPMTPDHVGVGATRGVQPRTLRLFSELVSEILSHPLQVINNGLFLTKQQGVAKLLLPSLAAAVHLTNSCPRWSYIRRPCGICTSCLERQMALRSTSFEEPLSQNRDQNSDFEAMAFQVERLRLELPEGVNKLAENYEEVDEAIRYAECIGIERLYSMQLLAKLYGDHVREFDGFYLALSTKRISTEAAIVQLPESRALSA